jgi:hypothetical protein
MPAEDKVVGCLPDGIDQQDHDVCGDHCGRRQAMVVRI